MADFQRSKCYAWEDIHIHRRAKSKTTFNGAQATGTQATGTPATATQATAQINLSSAQLLPRLDGYCHENSLHHICVDFFDSLPRRFPVQMLLGLYARARAADDHTGFFADAPG